MSVAVLWLTIGIAQLILYYLGQPIFEEYGGIYFSLGSIAFFFSGYQYYRTYKQKMKEQSTDVKQVNSAPPN